RGCKRGSLGWDLGALWLAHDRGTVLRRAALWHGPDLAPDGPDAFPRDGHARGGLPAAVWKSGKPAWLPLFPPSGKVDLPCCFEPVSEMRRALLPEPPPGAGTVLLVEDEDDVRTLTRRALQRQGYVVLEARHGREALQVWERHKASIELVIS